MSTSEKKIDYRAAGVDMDQGDRFVDEIAPLARRTQGPEVLAGVGGFGALFDLSGLGYREPVLVSGTDGVGTKVLLAHLLDRLDTVGIDLVAMCVNDILTSGAKPLFFLDYLATGKLEIRRSVDLVRGVVAGCEQAGCALVGGETAEMPGVYHGNEFDLAGFVVGIVEKQKILNGSKIRPGDVLLGMASTGCHSNGYSLVRKILLGSTERPEAEEARRKLAEKPPELGGTTLAEAILAPTKIYVRAVQELMRTVDVHGLAHITGAGLPGNVPRMFPQALAARVKRSAWTPPAIFTLLAQRGGLSAESLFEAFNMGIGMVAALAPADAKRAIECLKAASLEAYVIGSVIERKSGAPDFVFED